MPAPQHESKRVAVVNVAVITVSDTRTPDNDHSGRLMREQLTAAGHTVCGYDLLPDEPDRIAGVVQHWVDEPTCHAVLLSGGTGLARRDTTYEAVTALLDKRLDGFGELFRLLSYEQVGPAAMLSRAVAGLCGRTAIFSMPGSSKAVDLAMARLILPELGHVVYLATRG